MRIKIVLSLTVTSLICIGLSSAPRKNTAPVKPDLDLTVGTSIDGAVMKLLPKNSRLVHQVTEGIFGPADGTMGPNINVIYSTAGRIPEIMVLTPYENGKYKKNKPVTLNFPGMTGVEVQSVFFDQADRDRARELFVLCLVSSKKGSKYATAVFDWTGKEFKRMPKIEAKIKDASPAINVRRALREIPGLN